MSLKIKSALKSTGKSLKSREKSLNLLLSVGLSTEDRELNQYKIVDAAYAAPNKGTTILYLSVLISPLSQSSISEEF